jgi:two-component system, OmpR family, phosphate regulon sensor histidine kinase PhoR
MPSASPSAVAPAPATPTASAASTPPTAATTSPPPARPTTPIPTIAGCPQFGVNCPVVRNAIADVQPAKLEDHLRALVAAGSRDPRHPGHAKAVAYIKEQLSALAWAGWKIESHRTSYQGIPLENIFASIGPDQSGPDRSGGWIMVAAHYDSIANRTTGWRAAVDPAPGADDNATGTAALLEFARIISDLRLSKRVVLAFFDGEELFYKGSAAYVQTLPRPYRYEAVINIDMVGFNPIADRLDLLWHTSASAALRDRVIAVNQRYAIGVSPQHHHGRHALRARGDPVRLALPALRRERRDLPRELHVPHRERHARQDHQPAPLAEGREAHARRRAGARRRPLTPRAAANCPGRRAGKPLAGDQAGMTVHMQGQPGLRPPGAANEIECLGSLAARAACASSTVELFRMAYDAAITVVPAPIFVFALYDPTSKMIQVIGQMDRGQELAGGSFPLGKGFTSRAIIERQPVVIREWSTESPIRVMYGTESEALVRPESSVTVPMTVGDRVLGVISAQSYEASAYDEDDVAFLRAEAAILASALESLERSAYRDPELLHRTSQLEAILAEMTDALIIVDADGSIRRINRAAREILALGSGPLVMGQPVLDGSYTGRWPFGPGLAPDHLRRMFAKLRSGEPVRDIEVELTSGPLRVVSFSGAPLVSPEGTFGGAVIVFRDITSRREIDRLKDEMLAAAWHDLRTPLTAIKGETQLLLRRLAASGDGRASVARGLEVIDRQANRLHELIDTLLDASGIQLGRLVLDRVPTDLVRIVRSVVETIQAASGAHDFRLALPEDCHGMWDGRRLRQVIENLLSNAAKYSPSGSPVEITLDRSADSVTLAVTDRGLGLDPADLERIFERGYRGDRARSVAGDGLGLYIARAIVTAHGGTLRARSDGPGTGSTFTFTIPMKALDD